MLEWRRVRWKHIDKEERLFEATRTQGWLTTFAWPWNRTCADGRHSEGPQFGRIHDVGDGFVVNAWNDESGRGLKRQNREHERHKIGTDSAEGRRSHGVVGCWDKKNKKWRLVVDFFDGIVNVWAMVDGMFPRSSREVDDCSSAAVVIVLSWGCVMTMMDDGRVRWEMRTQ